MTKFQWSRITRLPDTSLPQLSRELLTILELHDKDTSSHIDLAAVVFEVGPLQVINCQDGRVRQKRNVTLIDESHRQINLGLWPDFTDSLNECEGRGVIFQDLQLREYQGKLLLSTTVNTIVTTDPANDTVAHLNDWFTREGFHNTYEEL